MKTITPNYPPIAAWVVIGSLVSLVSAADAQTRQSGAGETITAKPPIGLTTMPPSVSHGLTPSVDIVREFGSALLASESFLDNRAAADKAAVLPAALPLEFVGAWMVPNGDALNKEPAFKKEKAGFDYPYVLLDTNVDVLLLHPWVNEGASVAVSIRKSGTYDINGAFARANNFQGSGNGVEVAIFRNLDTANVIFSQPITADYEVTASAPFTGNGVAPFHLSVSLSQGDTLRFVVFSGPDGDTTFDVTALKAVIAGPSAARAVEPTAPPTSGVSGK